MELYRQILAQILSKQNVRVTFPGLRLRAGKTVERECYRALQKIKAVIEDDSLEDFECVEKIVCIFEEMGCGCGSRHDF